MVQRRRSRAGRASRPTGSRPLSSSPRAEARANRAAGKRAPEKIPLDPGRGVHERFEIDSGRDPRGFEQIHQVLGRRVPRGTGSVGTAPEPPQGRIEDPDPALVSRLDVGERPPIGVVHVERQLFERRDLGDRRYQRTDLVGRAHADGVAQGDLVRPELEQIPYQRHDARHSPPGAPGSAGTPSGRRADSSSETAAAPAAAASAQAMKARPPRPSSEPVA